jgi:hypothetical protein
MDILAMNGLSISTNEFASMGIFRTAMTGTCQNTPQSIFATVMSSEPSEPKFKYGLAQSQQRWWLELRSVAYGIKESELSVLASTEHQ